MTRSSLVIACLVLAACSADPPRCVEGTTQTCACPGGTNGVQACGPAGSFGACDCGSVPDGGLRDGGDGGRLDDTGVGAADDAGMMVGTGETVSMMVGPTGGVLPLTNAVLTIPAGALSAPTMIMGAVLGPSALTGSYTVGDPVLDLSFGIPMTVVGIIMWAASASVRWTERSAALAVSF